MFDDSDFYLADATSGLEISAVVTDFSSDYRDLEKYGTVLSGWDEAHGIHSADPDDTISDALLVRLRVHEDLQPSWTISKDGTGEGLPFKVADRAKVAVSLIGATSDRHLTWSRGSILSRMAKTDNISASLAGATRAARSALDSRRANDLTSFDATAGIAEDTARALGVRVTTSYQAHLDAEAINVHTGGLALHDGAIPLRQLGLGSKRMLMTGLQKHLLASPHITLFDEVEVGLEPHRIARLLRHLQEDSSGQYLLTTHSPVVLRELSVEQLNIVHCLEGEVEIVPVSPAVVGLSTQGSMRSHAEAFLAPKLVVCEGATEVGLLRGLDNYWTECAQASSFAYNGIALVDARGASTIKALALGLKQLGYDVMVLADSDEPRQFSDDDASELRDANVSVTKWADDLSLEERVFTDLPWAGVTASIELACELWGASRVVDQVRTQYGEGFTSELTTWVETPKMRSALGKAAKASAWFKQQGHASNWAAQIAPFIFKDENARCDLTDQILALRTWIDA